MNSEIETYMKVSDSLDTNVVVYKVGNDYKLKRQYHSKGILKLVGMTEEEYARNDELGILVLAPPDEVEYVHSKIREVIDTGISQVYSHRLFHKEKGQIWVNVKTGLVGEMEGEKLVLIQVFDVSKQSEQYEQIINQTERLVYVVDRATDELLFANTAVCELYQIELGNYIGKKSYEIFPEEIDPITGVTWAKRALVAGKPLVIENHKFHRFFNINAKVGFWGSHDALFVYITDCTRERLKEEEERAHYRDSFQSMIEMNRHAVSSLMLNVTENRVVDSYSKFHTIPSPTQCSLEELAVSIAKNFPREEEVKRLTEILDHNYLLAAFSRGESKIQMEHFYWMEDKVQSLLLTTLRMLKNPMTGDVEAVIYTHDVTGSYLERRMKKLLWEKQYESMILIQIPGRRMISYDGFNGLTPTTESQMGEAIDYDEGRHSLTDRFIVKASRKDFLKKTELEYIVRKLHVKSPYIVEANIIDEEGCSKIARYQFVFLDERRDSILCTAIDASTELERDVVTETLNRRGFLHEVEDVIRREKDRDYAVIYFNIKHFKAINDRFGVLVGDETLKICSSYLKNSFLRPRVVSRIEGDHFALLVDQNNLVFQEFRNLCHANLKVKRHELIINLSCGIYMVDEKTVSVGGMIDRAKLAQSYIEDNYLKPYAIFDSTMHVRYMTKNQLNNDLVSAMEKEEFSVYYQPIYNAKTKKLVAAEALVRWIHPEKGVIAPSFFVPSLEETGRISELDFFVAKQVKAFLEKRFANEENIVPIDVNLTWLDFYDKSGMNSLLQSVKDTFIPKEYFRYEVTESTYTAITESSSRVLDMLIEEGCKILMDDFGSGYSSFSSMSDFNFQIIKLDMGFIQKIGLNEKTEAVIECMITMAHKLGMKVVAEGVENERQLQFLQERDCDYIQGYYFSKAVSEIEFARILDESQVEIA